MFAKTVAGFIVLFALTACAPLNATSDTAGSGTSESSPTLTTLPPTITPQPATETPAPSATPAPTATPAGFPVRLALTSGYLWQTTLYLPEPFDAARLTYGLYPLGGAVGEKIYAGGGEDRASVFEATDNFGALLDFIPPRGDGRIAVWPGDGSEQDARLAWTEDDRQKLWVSAPDGSAKKAVYAEPLEAQPPIWVAPARWSQDGQTLYFTREPAQTFGWVFTEGLSSLYALNTADGSTRAIVPFDAAVTLCLDDLSPDETKIVQHCQTDNNHLHLIDLTTGSETDLLPPPGVSGFTYLGGGRFSPDGAQVAFVATQHNPADFTNSRTWLAVADLSSVQTPARLVTASEPGVIWTIIGWPNPQTLLIQECCRAGVSGSGRVLAVALENGAVTELASAFFRAAR